MKKTILSAVVSATILTGCSSIVSKSNYPVTINSNPNGATFIVTNKAGEEIHNGTTPSTVTLKSSAGYFKGESYTITLNKEGYDPKEYTLASSIDGWYFGNILFGGVIGMLIVDPATGAMYNLPSEVGVELDPSVTATKQGNLTVATIDTLTEEQKAQLQEIK